MSVKGERYFQSVFPQMDTEEFMGPETRRITVNFDPGDTGSTGSEFREFWERVDEKALIIGHNGEEKTSVLIGFYTYLDMGKIVDTLRTMGLKIIGTNFGWQPSS